MPRLLLALFYFVTLIGLAGLSAHADSGTELSTIDADSIDEAVANITAILEDQGFEIVLIVDHAAAAASVELELGPTKLIFARPPRFIERLLLKRSDTIGLDLPLKILVFENELGAIEVTANQAGYLQDRHDVKTFDPLLRWLQSKTEQFSDPPNGLVTISSNLTFERTVEALKSAIPTPPFGIPLELDYEEGRDRNRNYRSVRLPFLLVFGNPAAGTPLMQADQRIALDLPQKFLVTETRNGDVNITWNDPFFIAERYNLQGQETRLAAIARALNNFAQIGAGN